MRNRNITQILPNFLSYIGRWISKKLNLHKMKIDINRKLINHFHFAGDVDRFSRNAYELETRLNKAKTKTAE